MENRLSKMQIEHLKNLVSGGQKKRKFKPIFMGSRKPKGLDNELFKRILDIGFKND